MATAAYPARSRRPIVGAAVVAALGLAVTAVLMVGLHRPAPAYPGLRDDSVLTGTVRAPALATEGDAVRVVLAHGSVLATVSGPVVPGEGLTFQAQATTCTWTLRFTDATTTVPLALRDFDTVDHGGLVYHPFVVPGTPAPPAVLRPGQSVTFQLRAAMVVGEGLLRYAPDGRHIEAKWDFEVEND